MFEVWAGAAGTIAILIEVMMQRLQPQRGDAPKVGPLAIWSICREGLLSICAAKMRLKAETEIEMESIPP